jgi:hypothetical protein
VSSRVASQGKGGKLCTPTAIAHAELALPGHSPMDDSSNMFRLAIGVFYECQGLASAVRELLADGVAAAEMCLAGTRKAIDAFAATDCAAASSMGKPQPLVPQISGLEVVVTDGPLLRSLLEHAEAAEGNNPAAHNWRLPDLFDGLRDHLRSGAIALLVSASDFGLQRRGSRILLRHTADTLQTHEFTARRTSHSGN